MKQNSQPLSKKQIDPVKLERRISVVLLVALLICLVVLIEKDSTTNKVVKLSPAVAPLTQGN